MKRQVIDKVERENEPAVASIARVSGMLMLDTHLPYNLARCANRVSQVTFQKYKMIDENTQALNQREFRTLIIVSSYGPVVPASVAQATGMDRATVTRALKTLKDKKLVVDFTNERDGRSKYLVLTKAGAEMCEKIIPVMKDVGHAISSIFTEEESAMLKGMLDRVFDYVDENSDFIKQV